jgi:hypothetical protein
MAICSLRDFSSSNGWRRHWSGITIETLVMLMLMLMLLLMLMLVLVLMLMLMLLALVMTIRWGMTMRAVAVEECRETLTVTCMC